MTFGAERTNTCPLHFGVPIPDGGECYICQMAGLHVLVCDPSQVHAMIDAVATSGIEYVADRSRAILVFRTPAAGLARKPLAHVPAAAPAAWRRADGRARA